ncbi:von Willebrand factor [Streptomyces sp. YIM 130001]|uniref:vWA domain-containing protein n=1 Tax=Streptomyces sp. YIM 130001 TaxID=2259644 RepID=UPI000E6580C4|nr:VWA domain-containing protein [Streptomyces sp. YIM 130001]RII19571.1 von Willebrand factor [Streptomyces sp. YIM 130001]
MRDERRLRGRRVRTGLLAAVLAGGVLLTGCTGGGDGGQAAPDNAAGGAREGAPAPAAPDAAKPEGSEQDGQENGKRGAAPPPDYLSTFALDVDTASYGYARRTLENGRMPQPSTVRPEEFVNSFRQDYERPDGNGFSVSVDGARAPAGEDWSLMRVGLATEAPEPSSERPPAALTFVIDVSGSMGEPDRLDLAKKSLGIMTDQLRPDDSVSIVTFSDESETVLPMTRLGENRGRVRDAVESLSPQASTNLDAGIQEGYAAAVEGRKKGATNRVVLLSDALANTGDTDADAILEKIATARREHGITLFGVGVGSDYGDALMERLTNKGDGHTSYVSDIEQARKVFCDELPAHIDLKARDAKAQVAFDRKTVEQFRLIGYDNRRVADDDFRDDSVDGGEVGPGHTVTALYAVRLKEGAAAGGEVAKATVRWLDPKTRKASEESKSIRSGALDESLWDGADRNFQVAAVAAYFADALRTKSPGEGSSGGSSGVEGSSRSDRTAGPEGTGARREPLPGAPGFGELTERAQELADDMENKPVRDLAAAVAQARDLGA